MIIVIIITTIITTTTYFVEPKKFSNQIKKIRNQGMSLLLSRDTQADEQIISSQCWPMVRTKMTI